MATNESDLKKKRSLIKSYLTRQTNAVKKILQGDLTQIIVFDLQERLNKIEPLHGQFEEIQLKIENLQSTSEVQDNETSDEQGNEINNEDEQERSEFEEKYFAIVSAIKAATATYNDSQSIGPPREQTQNNNMNNDGLNYPFPFAPVPFNMMQGLAAPPVNQILQQIKLPTISLPEFNGQYDAWPEFRDCFNALVNDNLSLSPIQKFYYLRSSLKSNVRQIIESIQISADNYPIAWAMLTERYEQKALIIHSHVQAIFDYPAVTHESHVELRKLFDTITKHLRSLEMLGEPTQQWDTLIVYLFTSKMDHKTRREWELFKKKGDVPVIDDINSFFKERCEMLEKIGLSNNKSHDKKEKSSVGSGSKPKSQAFLGSVNSSKSDSSRSACYNCKGSHTIFQCDAFLKLQVPNRIERIKELKLCYNCLKPNHGLKNCNASSCKQCNKRHNSLLHLTKTQNESGAQSQQAVSDQSNNPDNGVALHSTFKINDKLGSQVLLSTAVIQIKDHQGQLQSCRALLDSGAQACFLSKEMSRKLKLPIKRVDMSVVGIGNSSQDINSAIDLTFCSSDGNYRESITCFLLEKVTKGLPSIPFSKNLIKVPSNVRLADPDYCKTTPVDMIIGGALFWKLLCIGQIQLPETDLTMQKTRLGWIIAGTISIPELQKGSVAACCAINNVNSRLNASIERFWSIETVCEIKGDNKSISDQFCERHFLENTERNETGQFVVKMPLKEDVAQLGKSKESAKGRFLAIERKLSRNPQLKREYSEFMTEYARLGHMSQANENDEGQPNYYVPQHAVVREASLTTKVRVVFDASMKTDSGKSLNDIQHVGPTIQNDLFSILVRFRSHTYVFTADISKMYRMIWLHPEQRALQKIFWRNNETESLECYELNTVTYGMASAPFLAIRCVHQLAIEHEKSHPAISEIIKKDFYVDDVLSGCNSREKLGHMQQNLNAILLKGGFQLRKWLSNDKQLLEQIQSSKPLDPVLTIGDDKVNKTLGILWNANSDTIQYSTSTSTRPKTATKRSVLSAISQVFDPLGLLGPIVILAKLLMQKLWLAKLSWDESLPQALQERWSQFTQELSKLSAIKIPRLTIIPEFSGSVEVHVFADASQEAYGACIYLRSKVDRKECVTHLAAAKSRVAPLKQISLPRLELCAALLAAQLARKVKESLRCDLGKTYFWSDSTIVLCWIAGEPTRWKTFVANRVSEIQSLTKGDSWNHVVSKDNPADLISRGTSVDEILNSNMWLHGPAWLSDPNFEVANQKVNVNEPEIPEQRKLKLSACVITNELFLFKRFSSAERLIRGVARILRFISRRKTNNQCASKSLNCDELNAATISLLKWAQQETFSKEHNTLAAGKPLSKTSKMFNLNPFIDAQGLIRVGGRIVHANVEYEKRHPIVLSPAHHFTKLLFEREHERLMHCGPTMLLASFREKYWPISGRKLAKFVVRSCVKCFRVKPPIPKHAQMGNLPEYRVNQSVPFFNTGCDFAGPFLLKDRNTRSARGAKLIKGYICLFICLSSKAIHLELVTELSTDAFIASFRRFISRRGKPKNMYSDNGTNFKGTETYLNELYRFIEENSASFSDYLAKDNITWHFIPARSPNFGGIWESNIRRVKYHLKRVIGEANLNYEDFMTVLVQIEAILNSTPICPISSDPSELSPLTPAHFLIGKPLTALPDRDYTEVNENRLKKYERLQAITQHFWKRWHREYLGELQTRAKWNEKQPNLLKEGMLVLIEDELTTPLNWRMGRIVKLHPGTDNIVRVVSVYVNNGKVFTRAVSKVRVFPFEFENAAEPKKC